jgi:hypothetical protein
MTKSPAPKPSGGIKPLNAPRIVNVRTDPSGTPVFVQVPPAIDSPRARRKRRINPQTLRERRQNQQGERTNPPRQLITDGKWLKVAEVENLWKVNDEWWRGPDEEIARLYYVLRLESGQQLTVYLDLIANNWYRQAG